MRRKLLVGLAAVVAAAAIGFPLWGPPALRHVDWFRVERVEVSGTRFLAPHQVLAAAHVTREQNVWDDPAGWESALLAQPAIAHASVTRDLPHTLRIRVEEKRPVAFVEEETLAPITATGEILPLDPTRTPMDLPVIRGAWEKMPTATRAMLLGAADRIARLDPALLAGVSEIRAGRAAGVVVLTHRLGVITLPAAVGAARLGELQAVLDDLRHRVPAGAAQPALIDLRFGDQVVVRLPSTA